jgi:hypothetical protein
MPWKKPSNDVTFSPTLLFLQELTGGFVVNALAFKKRRRSGCYEPVTETLQKHDGFVKVTLTKYDTVLVVSQGVSWYGMILIWA